MAAKKSPKFLLFTFFTLLTNLLLFKSFRKTKIKKQQRTANESADREQAEYSLKSERLWVDAPVCPDKYSLKYNAPVFYQDEEHINRVMPVERPDVPGFFNAFPGGLHINQHTGEIDINASESGIRYSVEFTPCGEQCVAKTDVVKSGIWYKSRIFSLSTSPPEEYIAKPFYNGDPKKEVPSGTFGINNNCPENTSLNGLIINRKTGEIDLKETIKSGALGFRKKADGSCDDIPENGTSKDFKIYYRLKDQSNGAVNETSIRIHFYTTREDIPYELQRRIEQQNNSFSRPMRLYMSILPLLMVSSFTIFPDLSSELLAALVAALSSLTFLSAQRVRGSDNPGKPSEHCATV